MRFVINPSSLLLLLVVVVMMMLFSAHLAVARSAGTRGESLICTFLRAAHLTEYCQRRNFELEMHVNTCFVSAFHSLHNMICCSSVFFCFPRDYR
jgi:hypothetical protein